MLPSDVTPLGALSVRVQKKESMASVASMMAPMASLVASMASMASKGASLDWSKLMTAEPKSGDARFDGLTHKIREERADGLTFKIDDKRADGLTQKKLGKNELMG